MHAQAYFVYDSKKSGGLTVSHLRFGPLPHRRAVAGDQGRVRRHPRLHPRSTRSTSCPPPGTARRCCSTRRSPPDQVWDALPGPVQQEIIDRRLRLFAIDADAVAREAGLPGRTNTVLQTCFFAISGVLPREEALERVKATIRKTYGRRGREVVRRNEVAVDSAVAALAEIPVPGSGGTGHAHPARRPGHRAGVRPHRDRRDDGRPRRRPAGQRLPVDGTFPSGTTTYEKRRISDLVAEWDPDTCIQCGNCSFVCPHSVIRAEVRRRVPRSTARPRTSRRCRSTQSACRQAEYRLQVYVEDCTGCGLCVESCPVSPADDPTRKAINLEPRSSLSCRASGSTSSSSRRCRSTSVRGSTSGPSAAPSSSSRCSSSPARAPAAARRPTSSCSPSCSASGRPSPTPPAARRSTAATCRPRRGRRTRRVAGRPGRTRCSRTTPSSASGLRLAADLHTKLARERLTASCATSSAPTSPTPSSTPGRCASPSSPPSGSGWPSCTRRLEGPDRPRRRRPAQRGRPPAAAQRVDRRRRRLGLRHRVRRARPRARHRARRQRARPGHRGLLQHRRAVVQVHTARRRGQVRRRRQDGRTRRTSHCRRWPTATSTSRGWPWAPTHTRRSPRSVRPRPTTGRA